MLAVVPTCSSAQAAGSPSLAGTSADALDLIGLILLIVIGLSRILGVHAKHHYRVVFLSQSTVSSGEGDHVYACTSCCLLCQHLC